MNQLLKRQKKTPLEEPKIWDLFIQIALGVYYLHSQRILHRDIKAANVFLTAENKVKIGDLGVARVLGTETYFAKTCVGTPYYLSPELCEDKPYNEVRRRAVSAADVGILTHSPCCSCHRNRMCGRLVACCMSCAR